MAPLGNSSQIQLEPKPPWVARWLPLLLDCFFLAALWMRAGLRHTNWSRIRAPHGPFLYSLSRSRTHTHILTRALRLHPFIKVKQETSRRSASVFTRAILSPQTGLRLINDRSVISVTRADSDICWPHKKCIFFQRMGAGGNWGTVTFGRATNWWGHVRVQKKIGGVWDERRDVRGRRAKF